MKIATAVLSALALTAPAVNAQYVQTSGNQFTLNGSVFRFAGTNCYWCSFLTNSNDIAATYKAIAASGLKVVRIWGFNDVTSANGVYYQLWQGNTATVNTGATGLGIMDTNVAQAAANNLKLVIPLTNNWGDYGGMDVYVKQLGGSGHSSFYTQTSIINAYKNYIKQFVSRYTTASSVMAWQLANEPRCSGCPASTVTSWASQISSYIKSIDSNHLVAMGDEGFFNHPGSSYIYSGSDGMDFEANLAISTIDYGTFHFYPDSWSVAQSTGTTWVNDHATACKAKNKPCVMEEYGTTTNRDTYLPQWQSAIVSSGLNDQYWQFGLSISSGKTANDGFTIYNTDSDFQTLVVNHAAAMNALSGGSTSGGSSTTTTRVTTTTTSSGSSASTCAPVTTTVASTRTVTVSGNPVTVTVTAGSSVPTTTTTRTTTTSSSGVANCAQLYGQCGGQGYTGPTCCASGSCKVQNQYYSQCL
ncbi:hypothetical protein HDV00_012492 [Rhizophlyctis rosea]|nr:hypothetical protein HDV00_012492 [Rhizophlyctis rosea]